MRKTFMLLIVFLLVIMINMNAQENAFTIEYPTGALATIDLSDGSQTGVGTAMANMGGMEFGPDNVLYGMNSNTNQLFEIDTTDASTTLIGSSTIPSTHIWTGLAYDPSSGIMYGMAAHGIATGSSNLYEVDLTDGSVTLIGSQGTATAISCIAIDDNGQMYGLQLSAAADIYLIDKTDGSVTYLGEVNAFGGAGMGYGMDFNSNDQTMYLTAYNSFTFNNDLYTVDLTNGNCTQVGALNVWTSGLAIISPFYADFEADATMVCTGTTVNFTDLSSGATSWSWTFEGGTPSASTDQNPSVVYDTPGEYDVELEIMDDNGDTETEIKYDYITVLETPAQADTPEGDDAVCTSGTYTYEIDEVPYASDYEWEIDPVDAGTLSVDMHEATLYVDADWTGDFTLKVRATNMCGDGDWSDDLAGSVFESPEEFSLEGGGTFCEGSDGVEITLDGSQTGIEYELYLDGDATGITVHGTGSELSFGFVTEEGFYEAIGSNDNCETVMTNQVLVTMEDLPVAPATPAGPETICTEPTADYTSEGGDGADSYVWELSPEDAGTISYDGLSATVTWDDKYNGMAYVSLYGENDCGTGESSEELEISVGAPAPEVSGEDLVCDWSDEFYAVVENEGSTYTWAVTGGTITEGQGTHMITVAWEGEGNGSVSVEEETAGGCVGESELVDVLIDDCTGTAENRAETRITLSPNPARDIVKITADKNLKSIVIIDLTGKMTESFEPDQHELTVNTSDYRQGIYLVKIITETSIDTKRLVIR